jgi:outer membrane protein insertion porin family
MPPHREPSKPHRGRSVIGLERGARTLVSWALWVAMSSLLTLVFLAPRAGAQVVGPASSTSASIATSASASTGASGSAAIAGSASASGSAAPVENIPGIPKTPAEEAEGATIRVIEVDGNARVASERIIDYLRLKVGGTFTPVELSQDVRELWASGLFDDIEVDLDRNDDGTVSLRFRVRERPNVKQVIFEGNVAFDTDKLREEIEVKENTVLSIPAVRRSVQKIKDKYAEKGFFLAVVTSEIVPQKDNEATVKFVIVEGTEVTIKAITFVGNYHIPDDELRAVMLSAQGGFLGLGSGATYRKDVFERDVLMLQALYSDRGYLAISVSTPRVMLTPDREGIEVSIIMDEGPKFTVKKLDIYEKDNDGNEIEPIGGRKKLRSLVAMKAGDVFNRALLIKDLAAVKTLYKDAGYANVEADPQTQLDFEKKEVSITVPIHRGPLVHIGRIEMRGNTKTSDKVIRREMTVFEGQLYSETGLDESRRRVLALGYFERVDVSTERGATADTVDVYFEVAERPTGTFQVGAGFSSIESFIATAQVQQANLFGRGQSLALQAQVSGLRQLVNIRFFEPYLFDSDWSASVDLYDQLRIFDTFTQTSLGGALTLGYPIIAPWLRATVTYTAERVKITSSSGGTFLGTSAAVTFFQRLPLANLFLDGFTSSVRTALLYDTRDNRLFPTNGMFLQASTELADPAFLSQTEYLRHRLTGRFYYNLGNNWVIKLNSEFGHVSSPRSQGVPIFARFFLGGIFDVRGFRLRSIGPRLPLNSNIDPNTPLIPNGANIGGNMQLYTNLELEYPILEKVGIRGVFFVDAGNTFNTESLYCDTARGSGSFGAVVDPCNRNLLVLRTSYGFGIRWFSPLGPLRFEWGFPFKPLPYEDSSVFEFTIGNFF